LDELIDRIIESFRECIKFPMHTVAHGFDEMQSAEKVVEVEIGDPDDIATISAIDGGSNTIIRTPTSAIVLNRVYCNKYSGLSKLDFYDMCEFVSDTRLVNEGGRVFFRTEILPIDKGCGMESIKVDTEDDAFRIGNQKGDLSRALAMARNFAELRFIRSAFASKAEFVLMDGALQAAYPGEADEVDRIYREAKDAGTVVAGLSKSSTIFTKEGFPIAGYLDRLADMKGAGKWVIKIGRSKEWTHKATVYYAKLHEGAEMAFRLDLFEGAEERDLSRLLDALQVNSKYAYFPGYPLALIDAHQNAKVSEHEVKNIKDQILDRLDQSDARTFDLMEKAAHPHGILDKLGA
jgi:hypothetical protein